MNKRIAAVLLVLLPCIGCAEHPLEPENNGSSHQMSLSAKEVEQPGDEGEFTVGLTAHEEFVVLCPEKWIRLKEIEGETPEWNIVFSVAQNESGDVRTCMITIADNHEELFLNVTQGNYPRLCVLNDEQFVSDEASSFELLLLHDMEVSFDVPNWISFEQKDENGRYVFSVILNSANSPKFLTI